MIAVFAKYPAGHHRHKVNPDWHVFGDRLFDPSTPGVDNEISKLRAIAQTKGADVRIGNVRNKNKYKEAQDGHKE